MEEELATGRFKPGDRFYSLKDLSQQYRISEITGITPNGGNGQDSDGAMRSSPSGADDFVYPIQDELWDGRIVDRNSFHWLS